MASYSCPECLDTGRSKQGLSPFNDCTACGAAEERTSLEREFPAVARAFPDLLWQCYQRGKSVSAGRVASLEAVVEKIEGITVGAGAVIDALYPQYKVPK